MWLGYLYLYKLSRGQNLIEYITQGQNSIVAHCSMQDNKNWCMIINYKLEVKVNINYKEGLGGICRYEVSRSNLKVMDSISFAMYDICALM